MGADGPGFAGGDAMSLDEVRRVADAVLYEGYILYPYRASAQKNRSRWQFGVLMPPAYAAADPSEGSALRAEFIMEHGGQPEVTVTVRFLQVQRRTALSDAARAAAGAGGPPAVWDEAVAREVAVTAASPALLGDGIDTRFTVPGGEDTQTTSGAGVVRRRAPLAGSVSVRALPLPGPWRAVRLTVGVTNESGSPAGPDAGAGRDQALPAALVAAHMIITVSGGAFISMTDPPQWAWPEVTACENTGCWPV